MLKLMFKSIHSVQINLSHGNLSPFKISLYWLVTDRRYWKHAHLCCKRRVFSVTVLTLLKGGFIVTSLPHFAWLISTIVNATIKFKVVIKIFFSCLTSSNLYSKFEAFCRQQSRIHLALKNCIIVGWQKRSLDIHSLQEFQYLKRFLKKYLSYRGHIQR